MKTKILSAFLVAAVVFSSVYAKRPLVFPQVLPEDEPVLDANVAAWKAAPARKAHKMLVIFSNDAAEWHGEAVSYAQRVLEKACVKGGWRFDSADYSVLDDGKLVGQGAHGELMEACPVYREICLSQLSEKEAKGQ